VQVFDSLGNPHLVSPLTFKKTANNEWSVYYSYENDAGVPPVVASQLLTNLTLEFTDGILIMLLWFRLPTTANTPVIDWGNGTTPTAIEVTFDTTQFNSESVVISQNQNGFGAGNLTGVDIDGDGIVIASYSNGEQTKIAQLVLGKFVNPGGLRWSAVISILKPRPPALPEPAFLALSWARSLPTRLSSPTLTWAPNSCA
jgi:flagellar hook protein FlgE